jgi:RHS repeat-associated protein
MKAWKQLGAVIALLMGTALAGGDALAASQTRTSAFEYDAATGLLTSEIIEPDLPEFNVTTTYTRADELGNPDPFGNIRKTEVSSQATGDAAINPPRATTTTYDAQGRFATGVTNALSQSESRVYDTRFGGLTSLTGPNNLTTTFSYDAFGRKTLEVRADGTKTETVYAFCTSILGGTDPCTDAPTAAYVMTTTPEASDGTQIGALTKIYYDRLNRVILSQTQTFDESGTVDVLIATTYNAKGQVATKTRPYKRTDAAPTYVFDYDDLGRMKHQTEPDSTAENVKQTTYVYQGLTTSVTNANGQVRTTIKDALGQTISTSEMLNGEEVTTTFAYDSFGNVIQTTAPGGIVTTYVYDQRGRKTEMTDPDRGHWVYTYDALGELKSQTDAKGQVTTFEYDALGRMTHRIDPASGSQDTLVVRVSEDAYTGDAQFNVWLDNVLVEGPVTATTLHSTGTFQEFTFNGNWGAGPHTVQVEFLNDAWGGSADLDRNLYVGSITYNGVTSDGQLADNNAMNGQPDSDPNAAEMFINGFVTFNGVTGGSSNPSGPVHTTWSYDSAANGIGKLASATLDDGTGTGVAYQRVHTYDSLGRPDTVAIGIGQAVTASSPKFAATYRPDDGRLAGVTYPSGLALEYAYVPQLGYLSQVKTPGAADSLTLRLSEDAWSEDAQFQLSIDGTAIGTPTAVTTLHSSGTFQEFNFTGNWGPGSHTVTIAFVNDGCAWDASANACFAGQDRNLYVGSITYDGTLYEGQSVDFPTPNNDPNAAELYANSSVTFNVTGGSGSGPATVYWQAEAMTADAQVAKFLFGNSVETTRTYDPANGRLTAIQAVKAGDSPVQNQSFVYDSLGNLMERNEAVTGVRETFTYDEMNRMTHSAIDGQAQGKDFAYDAAGNITSKSDVGTYSYGTRPHAVTQVSGAMPGLIGHPASYSYDANGNMVQSDDRTIAWTVFNKAASITSSAKTLTFAYDSERGLIKREVSNDPTGTMLYFNDTISGVRAEFFPSSGQWKNYVMAPGGIAAIVTEQSGQATITRYLHKDHLGSTSVLTDENGVVPASGGDMSYDPWGKRRFTTGADDPENTVVSQTDKGFTGHQHLEELALIDMGGRVYDPVLGRFISADPTVQIAMGGQAFNPYTYGYNNPLGYIDPTGYFSFNPFKLITHVFNGVTNALSPVFHNPVFQQLRVIGAAVGCTAVGGPDAGAACAAVVSAENTAINGGSLGDSIKAAVITFATAEAFNAVGQATGGEFDQFGKINGMTPSAYFQTPEGIANVVGHAVVGCASAAASRGSCEAGAFSGGVGAFAGPVIAGNDLPLGTAVSASIGGAASVIGGGKFANGALTGAFGYLFNACGADPNGCFKIGAAGGTYAGVVASAVCDVGTAGACVLADPYIVLMSGAGGAAIGGLADRAWDALHGNSLLSQRLTYVYQLTDVDTGDVLKYGITSNPNPLRRYTTQFMNENNAAMDILATYQNRALARVHEFGLCTGYVLSNGQLPPLSRRC